MKNLLYLLSLITLPLLYSCGGGSTAETTTSDSTTDVPEAVEKPELTIGFIKLTDMAPLAIAKEMGYFEDEGLYVTLEAQANWKVLLDRVVAGELDGAHMLAGQPIGASIGFGTNAEIVTPVSLDLNGNGITVSNEIWKQMKAKVPMENGKPKHPIAATALKPIVDNYKKNGKAFNLGVVFPVSTHNYEFRYWLAAGGIHPGYYTKDNITGTVDGDVIISVTPPPQMPATMEAGTILGYCVGEPWNQQAVIKGIGVPVVTDLEIWKNNPEKVFGVTKTFADANPKTLVALTKAIIRACKWLDENNGANRAEAVKILAKAEYVGADEAVIANSMTGTFEYEKGDKRDLPDFNVFFRYNATYPFYSDCIWYLTQMRRWGQITEPKTNDWYLETARKIYLPEVWKIAAEQLVAEGKLDKSDLPATDGFKSPTKEFIDGIEYDGKNPVAYLNKLKIGIKDQMAAK
ncbi:CmpA/NrtA family ABC transporter substrate-binding protein [Haliscomenobacter hydrossis]|uniref:Nitrate/sulfonate/bicarbonate ABC transporter periplasmic protein n=1 Tax=Haliscomenobacter hydrossis (strain ATCC 27775 / DSM 1100 / LMG 10767 / O) TaxID=760192 RepID=F4KUJ6_HALH1|nr:CmpA/NrtA family ABC transporter substrate-binding protein [Haliscomenobacter hydrossis]AEE52432.1 nitrate/sulfonate/bicarbonate ABC transporter periplasmic protein [Haliscomenobacter hydrossis DSM 1100]